MKAKMNACILTQLRPVSVCVCDVAANCFPLIFLILFKFQKKKFLEPYKNEISYNHYFNNCIDFFPLHTCNF